MNGNPMTRGEAGGPRAFTLLELIVVVTIIGVLASVVIPVVMKSVSYKASKAAAKERMRQEHAAANESDDWKKDAKLPVIHRLELDLSLSGEPQRVGLEVYNRFFLKGSGALTIESPSEIGGPVAVHLPFPEGTIEATDVVLEVVNEAGERLEPDSVEYRLDGIYWNPELTAGERLTAELGFTTMGTERLDWTLPPAQRLKDIRLSLDLENTNAVGVSSFSLTPSRIENSVSHWEYENLVSNRGIEVALPGAESPSGRLVQLLRFMAVAVLVFGAGFLYMNERDCPGRLDEFRLGHFSLLAAIYSIFFLVFAVIIYRGQLGVVPALIVSALCSLPLLATHVARLANWRFSLTRILPLAVLTLVLVVNGVYGGPARDYIFLAVLVILMTYLTLSYGAPGERRKDESIPLATGAGA